MAVNIVVCGVAMVAAVTDVRVSGESTYPAKTWSRCAPVDCGMDERALRKFAKVVGGRGCVVRFGKMIFEWGDCSHRADVASAAKPVYAHFLFNALATKRISSLDEKVVKYLPALGELNPQSQRKDGKITWRHLANQTSCYGVSESPGGAFDYSDWQIALFWDLLFGKVYGANHQSVDRTVLRPLLTDKLQCQDKPTFMAFGTKNRPGRLAISPRDFARIGLLYLNGGRWNGTQLIERRYVKTATSEPVPLSLPRTRGRKATMLPGQRSLGGGNNQCDHNGGYSWLWWLNRKTRDGKRWWIGCPADMFLGLGHGGKEGLAVFPKQKIIVSWNATKRLHFDRKLGSEVFRNLVSAVVIQRSKRPDNMSQRRQRSSTFSKWSPIVLNFPGPPSIGRGMPNPFEIRLDVVFKSPDGNSYHVPGYYDGDGKGGLDGNIWRVRFSPDKVGDWSYHTLSKAKLLNNIRGKLRVGPVQKNARGFWKWGRLENVGTAKNRIRYFKFRDGPYWLKAGCDDPENFLGGFKNYDTLAKRKAAVDYLASRGINSMYIMLHTLGGDHNDVAPWLGATKKEALRNSGDSARFDIRKLAQWRSLFEYMQTRGVVPYLILEDDSAYKKYDHARYYREVIARFGDLPAVLFNLGEEANENYSLKESIGHMKLFRTIDPLGRPLGIHNVNRPVDPYIDAAHIDFTAIQTGAPDRKSSIKAALAHNQVTRQWIHRCQERKKRVLMIGFDEGRPEEDRRAWWSAYLGGGVWEAHILPPYDRPLSTWDSVWKQLGGTRHFMESMPFWEMAPNNDIVKAGTAFCLAKVGKAYAIYLPLGGRVRLELPHGRYTAEWWDPKQGRDGRFQGKLLLKGGKTQLLSPDRGDWALRIEASKR